MTSHPLTAGEMELLEFQRATWKYPGARDAAILERFGLSRTAYTQKLLAVARKPAAAAYDPQLVARLRGRTDRGRLARRNDHAALAEGLQ